MLLLLLLLLFLYKLVTEVAVRLYVCCVMCRRSLMQYLESRVTPLLAGILAYIDTNNNLDVLDSVVQCSEHWLRDMWFHMFSVSEITVLKYR